MDGALLPGHADVRVRGVRDDEGDVMFFEFNV